MVFLQATFGSLIARGHFVDIKYDQQRLMKLYAVNKHNKTIQVYSCILEACSCPYTGASTDRFMFSRLTS